MVNRYFSSRIGEGLIYDLRTQVFDHVQRQPLAFFTRAQTGSLVSRLDGDVVGAQQAIVGTLSSVLSNVLSLIVILITLFYLSWVVSLIGLVLIPLFIFPARRLGRRLQRLSRESMQLNAEMGSTMTERFNVAGAMLAKLYGRPREESELFAAKAFKVREIGVTRDMYGSVFMIAITLLTGLFTAVVYGVGGSLVVNGAFEFGTLVALVAAARPRLRARSASLSNVQIQVMTALVSFDRVFEVLDLEPLIKEKPGAVAAARPRRGRDRPVHRVSTDVSFRYPTAPRSPSPPWSRSRSSSPSGPTPPPACCTTSRSPPPPGKLTALVGPSGAGKTTITQLVSRMYDPNDGAVRIGGHDIRDVTLDSLHDVVGVVTQDAHLFHDTIRDQPPVRAPVRDRGASSSRRARPRRSGTSSRCCPTASTRSSATAATGCPAARSSGSPSPACCSRRRRSWCSTRRPRTWTPSPSSPSSRPCRSPCKAGRRWSSPTGCPPSARPTRSW